MKKTILKIMLALVAIAAPTLTRASVIWYDNFNYTNGSVITNTIIGPGTNSVWTRISGGANPSDMLVINSNLQVCATGGGFMNRQDDCERLFSITNGSVYTNSVQLVYASFTVTCTTAISNGAGLPNGAGTYFASFYSGPVYNYTSGGRTTNSSGFGYCGKAMAFTNGTVAPNTWRLGTGDNVLSTNANDGGFPVDLATNTPYQVVLELDPITLKAASIWVNPINAYQTGSSPVDPVYTAKDPINFENTNQVNSFAFRQPSSFGSAAFSISNICIATTFAEAMTNVMSTNAVPPVIAYQPVGVTNFVGSSVSMSAVANGQGLASMTYQWQQNGTNYPNATANIISIPTARTNDSGSYVLIATTPYGLSVTSTPTIVSISAGTNPPVFTSQPVSQSAYAGLTVYFSCSVISPGNLSYQWYSNNIAIAGANSSTLELDNVTSSYGASYKVAVTNDVNPIGVVSSNAVLTIKVPASVSIAYLRTLIDHTTFASTNVPPNIPYQVTGTVTTFTNLTTGNTSAYYLQDATAGINIFVTQSGAPLFRPAQGDVVTFVGVLSTYTANTAGLELDADNTYGTAYPYTSFTDTGTTNALPAARIIPFTVTNDFGFLYLATNLMESRVTLTNVYFGTRAGTVLSTSGNDTVTVTNASGKPFALEFYDLDLDTAGQTLPAFATSVTGVLIGSIPNVYLAVTRFSDIVVPVNPIPLTVTPSSGSLMFNWTDSTFSLQSATNLLGPWANIPGATSPYTDLETNAQMFYRLYHP